MLCLGQSHLTICWVIVPERGEKVEGIEKLNNQKLSPQAYDYR